MFFVFCLFCVFFGQKEKKEQIMQKRAEREKIGSQRIAVEKKRRQKPTKTKWIALQKKHTTDAHTRARTHHIIIKIERTTRNTTKHHGTRFCRSIRKRTGTSSVLFFSS